MTRNLLLFFLRARPIRIGGFLVAASVVVVVLLVGILQAMTLSGAQQANRVVGRFDNVSLSAGEIRLGSDSADESSNISSAMNAKGARGVVVGFSIYGINPDASPRLQTMVLENNWQQRPFPKAFELAAGVLPGAGGFAVSKSLAPRYPLGSSISFFGGALHGRVTGIVSDVYHRDQNMVLIPSGSIAMLRTISPQDSHRFSTTINVDVYWNGSSNSRVTRALHGAIRHPSQNEADFSNDVQSRQLLVGQSKPEPIEAQIAIFLIPALAGLLSARFGGRFVLRIQLILHQVGVAEPHAQRGGRGAVIAAHITGTLLGLLAGYVLLLGIRPIINLLSDSELGPISGVLSLSGRILVATVLSGLIGLAIFTRAPRPASRVARRSRRLTWRQIAPALALAFVFAGLRFAQEATFNDRFVALLAFSFSIMVLGPFVIDLLVAHEPASEARRLGLRRLQADYRASRWVIIGVGILLITSFGLSTFITSSIAATNAFTESPIPPHQANLSIPSASASAETSVRAGFESFSHVSNPILVRFADVETDLHDGVILVLKSTADAQRYTETRFTPLERTLLENGGVLRTKSPAVANLTLEVPSHDDVHSVVKVVLPAKMLADLDPSYGSRPGIMLAKTAEVHNIPVGSVSFVYTNLSDSQVKRSLAAPGKLGFDSKWVDAYRAPDVITEPVSTTVIAGGLSLMGALLFIYYAAASASALRPNLAGLRALGMRRSWLMVALSVQLGAVVVTTLVVASVASAVGVFAMLQTSDASFGLTLPWRTVGVQVLATLIGAVIAVAFASRRLRPIERMN